MSVLASDQVLSCNADYEGTTYALKLWLTGSEVRAFDYESAGPGADADCEIVTTPEAAKYGFNTHWSTVDGARIAKVTISDGAHLTDFATVRITGGGSKYQLLVSVAEGEHVCSPSGFLPSHIALVAGKANCVTL
jgi:hypothetical protein